MGEGELAKVVEKGEGASLSPGREAREARLMRSQAQKRLKNFQGPRNGPEREWS